MKEKICGRCKELLSIEKFTKKSCYCKNCAKKYNKEYNRQNKDRIKEHHREYYQKNNDRTKEYVYRQKNKDRIKEYKRKFYLLNKDKIDENNKKYRQENTDKIKEQKREFYQQNKFKIQECVMRKRQDTPKLKVCHNISNSMNKSLRLGKSGRHWEDIVGYNLDKLMQRLEVNFKPGMSWDNYGLYGWHIDHKKPVSWFNFISCNDKEFKHCYMLCNLQPLWASENLAKNKRFKGVMK